MREQSEGSYGENLEDDEARASHIHSLLWEANLAVMHGQAAAYRTTIHMARETAHQICGHYPLTVEEQKLCDAISGIDMRTANVDELGELARTLWILAQVVLDRARNKI